jgi:hypothetical protein
MSNSLITLIVKIFSWIVMGISILLAVLFFTEFINEEPFILWAYILVGIAALFAVVFPLFYFIQYPKNAVKALVGIVVLVSVFFIGYILADTTPLIATSAHPDFSNPGILAYADTGIFATYILFIIAVLALLLTGIRSIFNR